MTNSKPHLSHSDDESKDRNDKPNLHLSEKIQKINEYSKPSNKIEKSKCESNHISQNKINQPNLKRTYEPKNKIEPLNFKPNYNLKNKIVQPRFNPNNKPKNLIKKFEVKPNQKPIITLNQQHVKFIGIYLGDGGLYKKGYTLSISLNRIDEKRYVNYVKHKMSNIFGINLKEYPSKHSKSIQLNLYNKITYNSLISIGLKHGNKVKNQIGVPKIIKKNPQFLTPFIKGLFDTDGSIWVSYRNKTINLTFRNASFPLARDFKQMCNTLKIKTQPKITKCHTIDKKTGKDKIGYQVFIKSKFYVNRFLETIKPEKWKDPTRQKFIGTLLILLNSEKRLQNKIFKQIEKDFPIKSNRRYSVKFSNYLVKLSRKYGIDINKMIIEKGIKNALNYKNPVYNRGDAERFKLLFEKFGDYKSIREHEIRQGNLARKSEQISKHVQQLFKEQDNIEIHGKNGYEIWYKKNSNMIFDNEYNKFKKFQLGSKKFICRELVKILVNNSEIKTDDEMISELKSSFKNHKMNRLLNLLKNSGTKEAMEDNIKAHLRFVKYILDNKEDTKHPTKIWRAVKLKGKQNHAKELINDLINQFPILLKY